MNEEIGMMEDQSVKDDLKIKFLGRDAKISDTGRAMPIEEIRRNVAKNPKNIVIGIADGERRVGLYRNTYRLDTIEIADSHDLTDEQIREFVKQRILDGTFDRQITTVYAELRKGIKKDENI
jgi:hypothetical protein